MSKEFSKTQLDMMHEVINIGTGHAADALSRLIDEKVLVNVPEVKMVPLAKMPEHLGGPETPIVGLYFRFSGDLAGSILLFLPEEVTGSLVQFLTAGVDLGDPQEKENVQKSALMELGNIVANSYLNAIAELMDMRIFISVPYYSQDQLGAMIDVLLIQIAEVADYALLLETFVESSPTRKVSCNLAIFLEDESLNKIFDKTGLK
jgi:chemotaxis protein CheC